MLGAASKVYWPRFLPQRLSLLLVTGITDSMACLTSHPGNHTFCSARILRNELFHTKPRVFLPSHVPYYARPVLCLSTKATISVNGVRHGVKDAQSLLKKNWLNSISCPFPEGLGVPDLTLQEEGPGCHWVIGIDPDIHGAVALLKFDGSCCSAQVFDTPKLQVMVGKRVRNRPDARSIVQLLRGFGAPPGTTAYIEQSTPFPNDGKLGWYSGGYSYGLWIGVLVASGFSVSPISSRVWKDHYELSGGSVAKDDSRKAACLLFPSMSSLLKRKKDHGRAEALLIAAYAKGLKLPVG